MSVHNCGSTVSNLPTNMAWCIVETVESSSLLYFCPEALCCRTAVEQNRLLCLLGLVSWVLFFDSLNSLAGKVWKHYLTEFIYEPAMPSVCTDSN